jgi:hypothetical protein
MGSSFCRQSHISDEEYAARFRDAARAFEDRQAASIDFDHVFDSLFGRRNDVNYNSMNENNMNERPHYLGLNNNDGRNEDGDPDDDGLDDEALGLGPDSVFRDQLLQAQARGLKPEEAPLALS